VVECWTDVHRDLFQNVVMVFLISTDHISILEITVMMGTLKYFILKISIEVFIYNVL